MNNMEKYPFLFYLPKNNNFIGTKDVERDTWIVKIANFDYTFYDSRWMDNEELGNLVLCPDVDITLEKYLFYSEKEALQFIKNWWNEQPKGNS